MKATSIPRRWRLACAALGAATLALCSSSQAQTVPPKFVDIDLGNPTWPGSVVTNTDGSLEITGGGLDIWNPSDQCTYFYAWAVGTQWSAQFEVDSDFVGGDQAFSGGWEKCELMVRDSSLTTGPQAPDPFIAMMYTSPSGADWLADQYRTAYGAQADWKHTAPGGGQPTYGPPVWMKVTRNGSTFSCYYSEDGTNWTNYIDINTATNAWGQGDDNTGNPPFGTIVWPDTVAVGIAVTAGDAATNCTIQVSGLQVTFPGITPPTAMGAITEPQDVSAYAGCEAAFNYVTTNNSSIAPAMNVLTWPSGVSYQWYRNSHTIPGATSTSYTHLIDPSDPTENGAQYYCQATILPPYNKTVQGLTSMVVTQTVLTPTVYYTNGLKLEYWANIALNQLTNDSTPAAAWIAVQEAFDNPGGLGTNYATRNSGWFIPPTTDKYVFFVASADQSDLFLNLTGPGIEGKQLIAQEPNWSLYDSWLTSGDTNATEAAQKRSDQWTVNATGVNPPYANGIPLTAGQPYYIELDHQTVSDLFTSADGGPGSGDDMSVTYQTETEMAAASWSETFTNGVPSIIAGTNGNIALASWTPSYVKFPQEPASISVVLGANATFSAMATSDSEFSLISYQWYRNGAPIPGATGNSATGNSYSFGPALAADNNAQFTVVASTQEGGRSATSSVAVLTVLSNSATPAITYASVFSQNGGVGALGVNVLDIKFNKPMDPTSLVNAKYSCPGLTLGTPNVFTNDTACSSLLSPSSVVFSQDEYASVQIPYATVGTPTFPLTVTVTGAEDAWGNPLTANSASVYQGQLTNDMDIGTVSSTPGVPNDPAYTGLLWQNSTNSYTIQCEGSDIYNDADGFNFAYVQWSGDFDMVVRVIGDTHTSNNQKAGLMVRESVEDPSSRNWSIVNDPNPSDGIAAPDGSGDGAGVIEPNCRPTEGGATMPWWTCYWNASPPYWSEPAQYPNAWLRLKMVGNDIYGFYSNDGVNWIPSGYDNPLTNTNGPMAALTATYIGICQTAHNNDVALGIPWTELTYLATADYANFNVAYVEPTAPPVPPLVSTSPAPAIAFATFYTNKNLLTGPAQVVDVQFNKPMRPESLLGAKYAVTGTGGSALSVTGVSVYTNLSLGISPTSDAGSNDYSSVLLTVTGTPSFPLNVTVANAQDYSGNTLTSPNNAASANLCALINQDIGTLGTDPAVPGVMWATGTNSYIIQCEGSDIYNDADGFNFSYTELTGDFDVVVRVKGTTHTSNWSKAGLMVREHLTAGSRNWNIVNDPDSSDNIMAPDGSGPGASEIECNARNTTGGGSAPWQVVTNGIAPAYPNAWVRLQRTGTQLAAYYSTNGTDWTQHAWDDPTTVGSMTPLPATVYVGICQTAHNNDPVPALPYSNDPGVSTLLYLDVASYDNFNAAYVPVVTPTLTFKALKGTLTITYTGTLVSSPTLSGTPTWTAVSGATSPYTVPRGTPTTFYRARQ